MGVYDGSPRQGMEGSPGTPSGNDAYDRMTGKGVYYHAGSPAAPSSSPPLLLHHLDLLLRLLRGRSKLLR